MLTKMSFRKKSTGKRLDICTNIATRQQKWRGVSTPNKICAEIVSWWWEELVPFCFQSKGSKMADKRIFGKTKNEKDIYASFFFFC